LKLLNCRPGWRPRSPIQPGDVLDPPADTSDETASRPADPVVEYLECDPSFVSASWEDLQQYLDHTLEMVGVPPSAIRMEQRGSMSGVAIVAEQIPVILWAMGRQRPYGYYEDRLVKLVLKVGSTHLAENDVSSAELEAAAEDPGLVLAWPDMFPDLPGPERDQADQWLLDNGMRSRTQILMRREHLTRDEAEAQLEETAEDLKREQELLGAAQPAPAPPTGQQGEAKGMTDDELATEGDEGYGEGENETGDEGDY
jgi:hypothetical protein